MSRIRPIAIGIFKHNDSILVFEGHDAIKDETFYRPLGGGIEFGEYSIETIKREIWEEIEAEITNVEYIVTLENVFVNDGHNGHEFVTIYQAEFVDKSLYEQPVIMGQEDDGTPFKAFWKPLSLFKDNGPPLYPTGLLELLQKK